MLICLKLGGVARGTLARGSTLARCTAAVFLRLVLLGGGVVLVEKTRRECMKTTTGKEFLAEPGELYELELEVKVSLAMSQ